MGLGMWVCGLVQEYKKGMEHEVEGSKGDMGEAVDGAMDDAKRVADKVKDKAKDAEKDGHGRAGGKQ